MKENNKEKQTFDEPSISSINRPVLFMLVFAFVWNHFTSQPIWMALVASSIIACIFPLAIDRPLIKELLSPKPIGCLLGALVGGGLFGLVVLFTQLTANHLLDASLATDGSVPWFFNWLVELKGHLVPIHPFIAAPVGAILLGFSEEIFWRGLVMTRLMPRLGHVPSVLVSSILFSGFYFSLAGNIAAISAFIAGLALGALTIYQRSVVPAILCHALAWTLFIIFPVV